MMIYKQIAPALKIILPLLVGGIALCLIYRNLDWTVLAHALRSEVNYGIMALSLIFGVIAHVARGLRWHQLILPLIHASEDRPKLSNALYTVLGSYTINMGIPRTGELWRCAEYKRYENISFSSLLGTLINDRLADILSLGVILLGVGIGYRQFFWDFISQHTQMAERLTNFVSSPWLYVLLIVLVGLILGLSWCLYRHPNNRITQTLGDIKRGIMSVRQIPDRGLFVLYTIGIWGGYFAFFYTTFYAFSFTRDLPFSVGLIAFALSSMSALAPIQAGMGPWHFMVITTLVAYGVSRDDAGIFALIVHSIQTIWITLIGAIAIILLPLSNRHYNRVSLDHNN